MAITYVGAGTPGTTSATLPASTLSGDWVFCFAYRSAATAPTLPANWTQVTTIATSPAHIVGYRIYDGAWTMPTWTNATRVVSATVRPSSGRAMAIGVVVSQALTQSNIVWPTSTLQDASGTSCIWRGVVHARTDVTIPTPTGHNVADNSGVQPAYGTFYKQAVTDFLTVTSTISRSSAYTTCQFEVRDVAAPTPVSASRGTTWSTNARVTAATRQTTWNVAAPPPVLYSDDFNRADSSSLGAPWVGTLTLVSNKAVAPPPSAFYASRYGATISADQWSECDVVVVPNANGNAMGPAVRMGVASNDVYFVNYDSATENVDVQRRDAAGSTASIIGPVSTVGTGGVFKVRLEAQGSTIRLFINGVASGSTTDTSVAVGGQAGLWGGNFGDTPTADNWRAGDLPYTPVGGGTTPVSASRSTTWATAAKVSSARATTWNTTAPVSAPRATTWSALVPVAATRATTWAALARVSSNRPTTWNALAPIAATRATTWNVAGVLTPVAAARSTTWNTAAPVSSTRATTWAALARVAAATRPTTWNALAPVSSTRATTWNVAGVLTQVTAARSSTWVTQAPVSSTRTTTWVARALVQSARSTTWNALAPVSSTRATTWVARALVQPARSTTWATRALVQPARSTTWNTRTSVQQTRSTTWAVLASTRLKIGTTNVSAIKIGTTAVTKMYVGTAQVWP